MEHNTRELIVIDGVKIQLTAPDLDKDGKSGGTENLKQDFGDNSIMPVMQPTEISESLKELHNDAMDFTSRTSGMDMRAYLHFWEVSSVLALDSLVALGCLPTKCLAFSRQKKRLSKSVDGLGSKQIVDLVAGKRELEAKTGMMGFGDKMKGFFGGQPPEQPK